jgi:hypothetical protein
MARVRETDKEMKLAHLHEESPWIGIIFGIVMILFAFFVYDFFAGLEAKGGVSAFQNSVIAILSIIKFKYILSFVLGIFGVFHAVACMKKLLHEGKDK